MVGLEAMLIGCFAVGVVDPAPVKMAIRKVGGLWFWRIGRVGGSFYIARRS